MKKFLKGCAITALIVIAAGLTIAIILSKTQGKPYLNASAVDSFINSNKFKSNVHYDINDVDMFYKMYEVKSGDVEYSFQETIDNLDIELAGCQFRIQENEDNIFRLEGKNTGKIQAYLEEGTLHIKTTKKTDWESLKNCEIILSIPINYKLEETLLSLGAGEVALNSLHSRRVSLKVGAGRIHADSIQAELLEAEVDAGEIKLNGINATDMKVGVGTGNLYCTGRIQGNIEADCVIGNLELELDAKYEDYNYTVKCIAGNITLHNEDYFKLIHEQNIDNGSGCNIALSCTMGNIKIAFLQ